MTDAEREKAIEALNLCAGSDRNAIIAESLFQLIIKNPNREPELLHGELIDRIRKMREATDAAFDALDSILRSDKQ